MFKSDETPSTIISAPDAESANLTQPTHARTVPATAGTARDSTKDAGRVHFGAGMMRF